MRIQCLLLVKKASGDSKNKAHSQSHSGYALIAPGCDNSFTRKLLQGSIQSVLVDQVNPAPNESYEIIEVWEDERYVKSHPRLYVQEFNCAFVQRLYPESGNVEFVTRYRHQAVQTALVEENFKIIEKLLISGANISYRNANEGTLGHFAAERRSIPLMKLLCKHDANIDARQNDGATPLHIAVKNKDLTLVKVLLENGSNVNDKMDGGYSPLHLALKFASFGMAKLLIMNGADINAQTNNGHAPLHFATGKGSVEMCSYLVNRGANLELKIDRGVDVAGVTPLHLALKKKCQAIARMFVENGASLEALCLKGRNALNFAVASNDLETVEYLLNRNPDVKSPGNKKAFLTAFLKNGCHHQKIIEKMIACGFTVDAQDATVPDFLFGAIYKHTYELVQKLLEYGANVNQYEMFLGSKTTPINVACKYAGKDIVQLLLDHGADPCFSNGKGQNPLENAVEFGKSEVVKLLLDKNILTSNGHHLLSKGAANGDKEKMELLLYGICVDCHKARTESWLKRSIRSALSKGNAELVELLMKYGTPFDFQDIDGKAEDTENCIAVFLDFGFTDLDANDEACLRKLLSQYDITCSETDFSIFYVRNLAKLKKCAKALAQHVIKMEVVGKKIVEGNVIPNDYYPVFSLNNFRNQCKEEITTLKMEKVGGTEVTLHDILTKDLRQVTRYLRNSSIVQELSESSLKYEYPIFGSVVDCKFRQGNWRKELLERAVKTFTALTSRFTVQVLPYEVMEYIVNFLDIQDLIALQKCSVPKQNKS